MKTLRTILAILLGSMIAIVIVAATDTISFAAFKPADAPGHEDIRALLKWFEEFQKDRERSHAYYNSLPASAFLLVLGGWELGAFVGGTVSALIAGRARLIHAGIVGGVILLGTIINFLSVRDNAGFTHPDWMIIAGLFLPLPMSLLAGKIVSMLCSSPTPVPPS
jgi:hypothetical protein